MTVIEHCDHCEREFSETEDTFVSDTGSDICGWCAATWLGEERTRLTGQLAGAVGALRAIAGGSTPDGNASCATELQRVRKIAADALGGQSGALPSPRQEARDDA